MKKQNLISILFPQMCLICGKHCNSNVCNKCFLKFRKQNLFNLTKNSNQYFQKHLYLFKYENEIRNIILDYKFHEKSYLSQLFVQIIIKNEKICRFLKSYDIIIEIPIHKKRKFERGYDQSKLIAKKIAKELSIEYAKNALVKQKNTIAQSTLNRKERFANSQNVYKIQNSQKINGKRVILFDDIFTTGATANSCSKLLQENGAKEILIFTLAKDILKTNNKDKKI